MRTTLVIFLLILGLGSAQAQDHFASGGSSIHFTKPAPPTSELGIMGGFMYYNGDLNPSRQFDPRIMHLSGGLFFRRNLNSRFAWRIHGQYGKVSGSDVYNNTTLGQTRNASFYSSIWEAATGFEFNFFPFNPADKFSFFTPYIHIGVGAFRFNPRDVSDTNLSVWSAEDASYAKIQANMPFGAGIKFKIGYRFLIAAEWSMRKLWTDYLDDVSTSYPSTGLQRGDSKHNDWYSWTGIILTFRLGEKITSCEKFGARK